MRPSIGSPSIGIRTFPGSRVELNRASTMQTIFGLVLIQPYVLWPQMPIDIGKRRLPLDQLDDVAP